MGTLFIDNYNFEVPELLDCIDHCKIVDLSFVDDVGSNMFQHWVMLLFLSLLLLLKKGGGRCPQGALKNC
jgi:hypothetical protein